MYNVYEMFGDAGCMVDPETGEMINYTWREAIKECDELQDGRILDFENGKIYNPDKNDKKRWFEPKNKEWRVYLLPSDADWINFEESPEYRSDEFYEWLKEYENTEQYTLKEFQANFNSEMISDQSTILIEEIEL